MAAAKHQIVVVGGGAGGLELVTKLGGKLGKRGDADIMLIDVARTHIWKPLLHEVAAGTLIPGEHELDYLAQAYRCHFRFRLGCMQGLERKRRLVRVAATRNPLGVEIIPARSYRYDTLVIAVGSLSNDFGTQGVREHCLFLDTQEQASRFQQHLLESLLRAHSQDKPIDAGQLGVVIVGAGATGVELAAQLRQVTRRLSQYGLDEIKPERDIRIKIIEAGPHILPALPERLALATTRELVNLGIDVHVNQRVTEVTANGVCTADGSFMPAAIKVWAAGIKAPDFLSDLDGLETNKLNQLVVQPTLQTTRDAHIYALGDCAACPRGEVGEFVPPRAQAAHQQASFLHDALRKRIQGKSATAFRYRDYGSMVTLGNYSTVGSLMGKIMGTVLVEGVIARMVYLWLYKTHLIALHGVLRTTILSIANMLRRTVNPEIKLH
ncbi:MAG: NAD(P)/FAD-dependent oxidoreductase [Gammaproteobacteria bacterium]